MSFNARRAKALQPGEHIIVDDAPGLRLVARASRTTWLYRYKSPVDERMRQVAIGHWPEMGYPACLLYTSPSPRDKRQSRMPSSA